jgi:hypothetical protein
VDTAISYLKGKDSGEYEEKIITRSESIDSFTDFVLYSTSNVLISQAL